MSRHPGWRAMLRLAARDALRARGRSILVLVMIALPVLAVTTAAVTIATLRLDGAEGIDRRLGDADALVRFTSPGPVLQLPDPNQGHRPVTRRESGTAGFAPAPSPTEQPEQRRHDRGLALISEALGREVDGTLHRTGRLRVRTDAGARDIPVTELDLSAPVTGDLHRVVQGRAPTAVGEVAVTPRLAERGPGPGEQLVVLDREGRERATLEVVGIVRDPVRRDALRAVGLPGAFGLGGAAGSDGNRFGGVESAWLIDATGDVTWADVRALNQVGAVVLSRTVLADPPPDSAVPGAGRFGPGIDSAVLAVVALVVTMALLEVVLLAGPAFAVGARRQQRTLALVAATGGTPRQLRRVVLASALVLGTVAAVGGVLLGVGLAGAIQPLVQRFSGEWLGPFDVPWWQLLGIAGFGLLSAFLAAVVPAWLAARQDVVAVLAGRRGDRRPGVGFPLLGVLLLVVGVALAVRAAGQASGGELWIAASAVPTVLGMVLVIPVLVALVARLGRWLPLPLRYAVRDAARHRTRTVPAVAAVAATVMGVVALGIGAASDEAQNREGYQPLAAMGDGVLTYRPYEQERDPQTWQELTTAVSGLLPRAATTPVTGVLMETSDGYRSIELRADGRRLIEGFHSAYGSGFLVGSRLPDVQLGVPGALREEADAVLGRGGVVVFTTRTEPGATTVRVRAGLERREGPLQRSTWLRVPGLVVHPSGRDPMAAAVLAPALAKGLEVPVRETSLVLDGPIDAATERDVDEALAAIAGSAALYVERGYSNDDGYRIVLLVLASLGGVLMLGGTLTATFLALSDARPDLATLSAVGAAPRTRRAVAAAYALVVALVGAVTGALVGMVPGIAVSYPLTRGYDTVATHYLDIPWLLVGGVVVVLPVLAAAVVALLARSRLPVVARID